MNHPRALQLLTSQPTVAFVPLLSQRETSTLCNDNLRVTVTRAFALAAMNSPELLNGQKDMPTQFEWQSGKMPACASFSNLSPSSWQRFFDMDCGGYTLEGGIGYEGCNPVLILHWKQDDHYGLVLTQNISQQHSITYVFDGFSLLRGGTL